MFGNNPKRRPLKGDGSILQVQEIFPTVQGEGPHTGVPSVFVRLGGCNLACHFCDTEFESFHEMTLEAIMAEVKRLSANDVEGGQQAAPAMSLRSSSPCENQEIFAGQLENYRKLVVITGGEPLRQPIALLCDALITQGYQPQIETNGTLWRELPESVDIICSPKSTAPIRPDLLKRITAFKFVLTAGEEVPEVGQSQASAPVWIQAMDEYDEVKNVANLDYVLALAAERGYKVSLQTHKLFRID